MYNCYIFILAIYYVAVNNYMNFKNFSKIYLLFEFIPYIIGIGTLSVKNPINEVFSYEG